MLPTAKPLALSIATVFSAGNGIPPSGGGGGGDRCEDMDVFAISHVSTFVVPQYLAGLS